MINDQYSPEEQFIIQQIQAIPRLEISILAREAIRGRMLNEFRILSQRSGTNSVSQTRLIALAVTALIVVTVIVIIILAIVSNQNAAPQTAIATLLQPSATGQPTASTQIILSPTIATQINPDLSKTITLEPSTLPSVTETTLPSVAATGQTAVETASGVLFPPTIDAVLAITPSATTFTTASPSISATITLDTGQNLTPSATPTLDILIVIEGPVINVVNNVITIYDFDIEVEVNHPILNLIEPGDLVHIEGVYGNSGLVIASVVSNLSSAPLVNGATVSLDGPVESINNNIIVVNGIPVQLGENDPLLQTVQVGQFVSVQGNFQGSGPNIVLVVVTMIVNTNVTVTENDCWYHDGMGMGHWHCDGQGMGMGGAGMGMGMGGG